MLHSLTTSIILFSESLMVRPLHSRQLFSEQAHLQRERRTCDSNVNTFDQVSTLFLSVSDNSYVDVNNNVPEKDNGWGTTNCDDEYFKTGFLRSKKSLQHF